MSRDHDQMLIRTLRAASVRMVGDDDGFVREISAGWRPRPGGWFYSQEHRAGFWVSGEPGRGDRGGS